MCAYMHACRNVRYVCIHVWMDECTYLGLHACMDASMDGWMDGWMEGWKEGWKDGRMDEYT